LSSKSRWLLAPKTARFRDAHHAADVRAVLLSGCLAPPAGIVNGIRNLTLSARPRPVQFSRAADRHEIDNVGKGCPIVDSCFLALR
jgi:hypothetical protein